MVLLTVQLLWADMICQLVNCYWHFKTSVLPPFFKTTVSRYQSSQHNNTEELNLQQNTVMSVCLHCYTIHSTTALCDSITVRQLIKTFTSDKEQTFHCSTTQPASNQHPYPVKILRTNSFNFNFRTILPSTPKTPQ